MELLREKILGAMGLTEEDLESMPAEQRAQIEKMVEEEIKRRMEANRAVNGDKEDPASTPGAGTQQAERGANSVSMATGNLALGPHLTAPAGADTSGAQPGEGMGLGPLLALQEVAREEAGEAKQKHGKKDPEDV